ncbi:MAG: ParB/RepB/Spo0J family partition protein [Clostridiaceae bacterium]|jgi:ParB family chromosome partitioning protein|nr:ParB/RepB/Spo0J family partition protein [Clostridiaceae bacterium]
MANKKGGLGRGWDALIYDNSVESSAGQAVTLPINDIEPNRKQPRKEFEPKALAELSDSIKEHGVLQPLLVRPMTDGSYRLVAGERRYRAARMAGLTEVPVTIREMSDEEESVFALIENLHREDLNAIEEAEGFKMLIDTYGLTQEQAAQRVGKSRPEVANSLRILTLPEKITDYVKSGKISKGHAKALLAFDSEDEQLRVAELVIKDKITVRDVERLAKSPKKEKKTAEKREKKRDRFYDEVEIALGKALGRKVKVFNTKGSGGTLEIEFFSKSDLEKLSMQLDELE